MKRPAIHRFLPATASCHRWADLWVLIFTMVVPISSDRFAAPDWLKFLVIGGPVAAVVLMWLPGRGKTRAFTVLAALVSPVRGDGGLGPVALEWHCRATKRASNLPRGVSGVKRASRIAAFPA